MSLSTKSKWIVSTVIALGLTGAASATDREFNGSVSNSWNHADNWTPSGIPSSSDDVTIPEGLTCEVDSNDAEANSVIVETEALLKILDGATNDPFMLRLFGTNDMDSSVADDQGLLLVGPDSVLMISGDLAVGGDGSIKLQAGTVIDIEDSGDKLTLPNTTMIEGIGTIMGAGEFLNQGTVYANTSGTLELLPTTLEDTSSGLWRCNNGGAILKFSTAASLDGDMDLDAGTLLIFAEVTTNGNMTMDGGALLISADTVLNGDLVQDGGTVDADADFIVNGDYHFDAGNGSVAGGHIFQFATFSTDTAKTNPDDGSDAPANDPPFEVDNIGGLADETWS